MPNRWLAVTIDCADPRRLADFWGSLLDLPHQDDPLPGWARIGRPDGSLPVITFQPVAEAKRDKVRLHLDIGVDDIDAGIAEVQRRGGRSTGERHEYDEGVVVVMTDPEGNEFCLVQHFDDHGPQGLE
jgi:predicted enzyme related to lactoylglutathione lyase